MTRKLYTFLSLTLAASIGITACTDLEVEESDSVFIASASGEFTGVEPGPTLSSGYADLRAFTDQANSYALHEITSDELLVPTRGTDWGDNGIWRTLHQHTWDPTHPYVLSSWNQFNALVFKATQIIDPRSNANAQQLAEAKFLRAYAMYLVVDFFGQVPFREVDEGPLVEPQVLTTEEAISFIQDDLNDAIANLPELGPSADNIRAGKAAAHFINAKLHLNKHVFLGNSTADAADMDVVINSVNQIEALGYELEEGYFEVFAPAEDTETILYTDGSVGNRIWNGLHYFQDAPGNEGGGWNGFSTTAEFYALFEGDAESNTPGSNQEERRGYVPTDGSNFGIGYGMLFGQQYDESGAPLNDRAGRPLVFTKDFSGLTGNRENTGVRVIKYHPENGSFVGHYILFRFADAHLMKAEAELRKGNTGEALALVNELRTIRDASPLSSLSESDLLDERGRELYAEGWRRNDQIRFGTFTREWDLKGGTSEEYRTLFPIPANAVALNPNLEQNPGY
ncbi:RagB/SusD family nutrient uptake outer membrane protein [Roseivirga sp. BDSF3-8]|uniref:RagB/SusD family nutrient uptake outer membrane protein n=1 Tax=Roseivirga sp. BDSF3-8 TaxID=3241598 RepID=UPI003531B7DB